MFNKHKQKPKEMRDSMQSKSKAKTITLPPKQKNSINKEKTDLKIDKVIEAELVDEISPTGPKSKRKKLKKKKRNKESLEVPSEVVVKSEAIAMRIKDKGNPDDDGMVLEDIKNENRIAYGHEHHSEI